MPQEAANAECARLAIQLTPKDGESLHGFIARLEQANVYQPGWLLNDIGAYPESVSMRDGPLITLSETAKVSLDTLKYMSSSARHGKSPFMGHEVKSTMLMRGGRRLCIECVQEDPVHLNIWNFMPIHFCQKHLTPLVSKCPLCDTALKWGKSELGSCPNGHVLARQNSQVTSTPSRDDIETARWLTTLLSNRPIDDLAPHPIFASPCWNFERAVLFLDLLEDFDYRCKTGRGKARKPPYEISFTPALRMVSNWPSLFTCHLPLDRYRRARLSVIDKPIHNILSHDEELGRDYNSHVADVFRRGLIRFFDKPLTIETVTEAEGANLLEIPASEFGVRAKHYGWQARNGNYYNWLFDREKILDWRGQYMTQSAARDLLGIPIHAVKHLRRCGIVRASGSRGSAAKFRFLDLVRSDVENVARLMNDGAVGSEPLLPMGRAIRILMRYGASLGEFVNAALAGHIIVCGARKHALTDIEFACSDIVGWLKRFQQLDPKILAPLEKALLRHAKNHSDVVNASSSPDLLEDEGLGIIQEAA